MVDFHGLRVLEYRNAVLTSVEEELDPNSWLDSQIQIFMDACEGMKESINYLVGNNSSRCRNRWLGRHGMHGLDLTLPFWNDGIGHEVGTVAFCKHLHGMT